MKTVLVVEDEKMIRKGISSMIRRCGVPVETILECSNGIMAFDILQEQKIDVMFTDIRMPRMDGIDLVEKMQGLKNPPLTVVISGYDDFSYAIQMMRKGVREYLLKPVEREQITEIMAKLEQELEEKRNQKKHMEDMELQQIRYRMFSEHIEGASEELSELDILPETYVVVCFEKIETEIERDGVIQTGGNEGFYTLLTQPDQVEYISKDELQKSCLGISRCHRGAGELRMAYMEACKARKEAFMNCSHIVLFEKMEGWEKSGSESEKMEQIAQMLGTDKAEEAVFRLERMGSEARKEKNMKEAFEESIHIFVKKIKSLYQNVLNQDGGLEELEELQEMYHYSCITEFVQVLTVWCRRFAEKMNGEFENYGEKQKMQQAIAYIQEHFSGDLNMATVSNYISMNYSMFSSAFKLYTGTNFVNYLKNMRINEAKKLLAETDLRIVEISQKVGYDNEKHFMKTFKSLCGVSPTEFRRNTMYGEIPHTDK